MTEAEHDHDEELAADEDEVAPRADRDPLRVAAAALAGIAAVCAVWSGWSWHTASGDSSLRYSQLREEVLQSGEQAVLNMTSLDYRYVDKGLNIWLASSTGQLNQELAQSRVEFGRTVVKAKTISTSKIIEGAVVELDDHAGKARIIVAISLTVTPESGRPVVKRNRLIGELTLTGALWKLSALGQAQTGALGS